MTAAPLDPATIMAEHSDDGTGHCSGLCADSSAWDWPCLPYRLAADLAAAQAMVERARLSAEESKHHGDHGYDGNDYMMGKLDGLRDAAGRVLDALAGEGA